MKYKEMQIIKHALQYYVNRPNATESDIEEERRLLEKVTNQVEQTKQKYSIK